MDDYDGNMTEKNASLMSSLIAKLELLDQQVEELKRKILETKDKTDKVSVAKNEMNTWLINVFNTIQNDVNNKLSHVVEKLKSHQIDKRQEGIRLQQDISLLKKEKLLLYQQISDVTKRIEDTETIIGYDAKYK